jgi:hypothetical protein
MTAERQYGIHPKKRETPIDQAIEILTQEQYETRLEWLSLLIRQEWPYFLVLVSTLLVFLYMIVVFYSAAGGG